MTERGCRWVSGCFFADASTRSNASADCGERHELLPSLSHGGPCAELLGWRDGRDFLACFFLRPHFNLPANITCNLAQITIVTCSIQYWLRIQTSQACVSSYLLYRIRSSAVLISGQHV